jgi:serine/threonine protein kinase
MANGSELHAPLVEPTELLDWRGTERFEVLRCIGRGGMGAVYEARDRERQLRVALKTLVHFDPASFYLFKQEFRTLADVHHANLVRLYELVAAEGDRVFFSMELVRGGDFLRYVQKGGAVPTLDPSTGIRAAGAASQAEPPRTRAVGPMSPTSGALRQSPADLDRLLPALRQLVEGVQALHGAGKLHRDLKPSNVLVTHEGRVVLLDFGVATDFRHVLKSESPEDGQVVGTATYMAPEQAFQEAPTPAADWYSVGVMLYEALVGSPPFVGPAMEVIQGKNEAEARPASERVEGLPEDLAALSQALLRRAPEDRPTGREILERLGAGRVSSRAASSAAEGAQAGTLIGRESQSRALQEALDFARSGHGVTVRVGGRAGMGKSALVQSFLDGVVERGEAVVLRGRAYERESLPYKAVDSIVDALSRHLMGLANDDSTLPLPADIGALAHLFPVLRRLPSFARVPEVTVADPVRTRRRAFAALRELLATLARSSNLIVYIDDAQWGDTDSSALLLDLIRPPYAPPILLLLAYRDEDAATAPLLTDLRARWPSGADIRDIAVGPLDDDGARRLAASLLGARATDETLASAVARESGGSPFLVGELARHASVRLLASHDARVTIDEVIADRLAELPADARRLVEIVAVAGRPLPLSTLGDAAQTGAVDDVVALLAARRFVRPGLRDGREVAEPIHDRIRETIVAGLSAPVLRDYHGRLARILETTPGAEPESVAIHLLGAGETERGGRFAEKAADQAAKLLAFDQASRLFRLAIDTLSSSSRRTSKLHARLGEVLGWAGRNEEAGRAYIEAAENVTAAAERAPLERAAATQLIAAGRVDEGGAMLRRVLAGAGVKTPKTPAGTVLSLLAYKARLQVFGLRFTERDPSLISASDTGRIDAMHVAALGLASVDIVLATCMQAGQLVEALRAGDRARTVRAAVLYCGSHLASRGGPVSRHEQQARKLITELVSRAGHPEELAFARGTHAVGLFLRGHWAEAVKEIDAAYANLTSQQAGMQSQAAVFGVYAQAFLGNLIELRARKQRLVADAELRGDLFTSVLLQVSHPIVLQLAADDPDGARSQVRDAKARWSHGKFLIQDWQVMRSEVDVELYAGDGPAAYARLERDARELEDSRLLNVQFMRILTSFAWGRAAVASADSSPGRRAARLSEARRCASQIRGERMAWAAPLAAMLSASVKSVEGDRPGAEAALRAAVELAEAVDMSLYAAAARYQLGTLLGKTAGAASIREAEDVMRAQEVRECARFASMFLPGHWATAARQR